MNETEIIIQKHLSESNWTQLPDAVLSPTEKTAWNTYREALQNIDLSKIDPDTFVLPESPIAISTGQTQIIITARARRKAARGIVSNIPNWATWTQADWQVYFNTNLSDAEVDKVTTIALARVALKRQNLVILNLTKLVLAMRDQLWPDL